MIFCTPEYVADVARCRKCGIDFPPGEYDLTRIRRPCRQPTGGDENSPLRLRFDHGLGDAVQFTSVLRHFRHYWPNREIEINVRPGGQAELFDVRTGVLGGEDSSFREVRFHDCFRSLAGMPSTKAEVCLTQEFGLTPLPELWDYSVPVFKDCYLGDRPALLHYQGHCARESKDLTHWQAALVAKQLWSLGYRVLLWDTHRQSPLPEESWARRLPRISDASILAAILKRCSICVGIDSGPAHLAVAVGTPTVCIWTRHSPLHYFCPTPLAVHLVAAKRRDLDIHAPVEIGREFLAKHYQCLYYDDPAAMLDEAIERVNHEAQARRNARQPAC
ncbi:MAG: glycosyltransferase family 9 protein [Candidatus Dormibacteria bacterium]